VGQGCVGVVDARRNRGDSRHRCEYSGDKPPVFIIADRGTGQRYVIPAKAADESMIRLLLADCQQESLTVYTDGFRAYEPLEEDDEFNREYDIHGDGEYADDEVHVNSCESHASQVRQWLSPHRGISKDKLTQYLKAFQLRRELFRNPAEMLSNTLFEQRYEINNVLRMSDRTISFYLSAIVLPFTLTQIVSAATVGRVSIGCSVFTRQISVPVSGSSARSVFPRPV